MMPAGIAGITGMDRSVNLFLYDGKNLKTAAVSA